VGPDYDFRIFSRYDYVQSMLPSIQDLSKQFYKYSPGIKDSFKLKLVTALTEKLTIVSSSFSKLFRVKKIREKARLASELLVKNRFFMSKAGYMMNYYSKFIRKRKRKRRERRAQVKKKIKKICKAPRTRILALYCSN